MKTCKDCNQQLDNINFPKNSCSKDGLSTYCKRCCSIRTMKCRYKKQGIDYANKIIRQNGIHSSPYKVGTKEYRKNFYLISNYSITLEVYNKMLISQDNKCLICNRDSELLPKMLAVDHDHKTGKIRGLLCIQCNTGIGSFQDDSNLLKKAISYLEESTKDVNN